MPYIAVTTNATTNPKVRDTLLADLVATIETHLDKPKGVTMAHVALDQPLVFKGSAAPAAYVSIRAIGLPNVEKRAELVSSIASMLEGVLGVPTDRTFVVLDDVSADRWGARGTILT